MVKEKFDIHMQNIESRHKSYAFHKSQLKVKHKLIKWKTIQVLEDNRKNLGNLGFGNEVLNTTQISRFLKKLISETLLKLKTLAWQDTLLREWKEKPCTGSKYLQNTSLQRHGTKIYKELLKPNTEETNNPMNKWVKQLNRSSPIKICLWQVAYKKGVQHHLSLGNSKCKQPWGATKHPSDWLKETKKELLYQVLRMRSNRISYLSLLRTLGKTDGQSLEELIIVSPCVLQIIILTTGNNQDILYSGIDKLTGAPIQCNIIHQ